MNGQLWVVTGHRPVLWTLPVWVLIGDKAVVRPAMALREKEAAALRDLMRGQEAHATDDGWTLGWQRLKQIARPVADDQPERWATWARGHASEEQKADRNHQRSEFTDALYAKGWGKSREEVAMWWQMFAHHALDWLINKERVVDFSFVRLWPSIRRLDWKPRVTMGRRDSGIPQRKTTPEKVLREHPQLHKELVKGRLLAVNPDGTVDRQVEIEHTRLWWSVVRKVELERRKLLKKGYGTMVAQTLERQREWAAAAYAAWHRAIYKTSATLVPSGVAGAMEIVPSKAMGRMDKRVRRTFLAMGTAAARASYARRRESLQAKAAGVSDVRDVQSPGGDMRNGGGVLHGLPDEEKTEVRVLVSGGGEMLVDDGELLAAGVWRGFEMAGLTKGEPPPGCYDFKQIFKDYHERKADKI